MMSANSHLLMSVQWFRWSCKTSVGLKCAVCAHQEIVILTSTNLTTSLSIWAERSKMERPQTQELSFVRLKDVLFQACWCDPKVEAAKSVPPSWKILSELCLLTRTEALTTVLWWTESFHNNCLECLAPATFLPCCLHSCPFPSACTDFTWQGWKLLLTRWFTANLLSIAEHHQAALIQHTPTTHWWSSSLTLCLFHSTLLYLTRAAASELCLLN